MRRTAPLIAASLLGLALLVPTTTATAAAETCRGETATIVGTTPTLTGTEGGDVIVTGDSSDVFALGGDDLICVRGSGGNSNLLDIDSGSGNDVVDTTGMRSIYYIDVILGTGADTHVGGVASESVVTGTLPGADVDPDSVDTGWGDDSVSTGSPGVLNHDAITLGSGNDDLDLRSAAVAPDAVLAGGTQDDTLRLEVGTSDTALDMTLGTVTSPQGTARFASFEVATLSVGSGTVSYRGTSGDDSLTVHPDDGVPMLDISTLAGDDEVVLQPAVAATGSSIDAGRGEDNFVTAARTGSIELDLKYGRVAVDGVAVARMTELENAFLMAPEVSMVGNNADNSLDFNGCDATIRGGHGRDSLNNVGDYYFDAYTFDCRARATMLGGPGNDRLRAGSGNDTLLGEGGNDRIEGRGGKDQVRGGAGRDTMDGGEGSDDIRGGAGADVLRGRAAADTLIGGGGRDRADGSQGRDRCAAERERRCER